MPLTPEGAAQLRRKWRSWLPRLTADLGDLLARREIFEGLSDVARGNPRLLDPGDFLEWTRLNYVTAACLGVRRLTDCDRRSVSLGRLLCELAENATVISRHTNRALYRRSLPGLADLSFDSLVGKGCSHLLVRPVRRHLAELQRAERRIRRLVNKRLAHAAPHGKIRRLPTYADLDAALAILDRTLGHYNTLLTGAGLTTMRSIRQYDWQAVFHEAWLPPRRTTPAR